MWTVVQFVAALLVVLGAIGALAWAGQRFGLIPGVTPRRKGQSRRLAILEVAPVDAKRRLLLVRRDSAEHLILLGPTSDLVIEANIAKGTSVTTTGKKREKEDDVPWTDQ